VNNILEELGVDPDDFTWEDLALCQNMDTELFFDKYVEDPVIAKETDEMCLHCPVLAYCHSEGPKGNWGVWGAVYWNGAGRPDESRNAHKTPEVWNAIQDRLADDQ
jgi:hypothetical protein